jgi:hypothetical protein
MAAHPKEPAPRKGRRKEISFSQNELSCGNGKNGLFADLWEELSGQIGPILAMAGWIRRPPAPPGLCNNSGWQDVDAHGEVQFQNVSPDQYEVLNVTAGSSLAVALSLAGGAADVEGFTKRAGKGVPGAMIVLVPKNPAANRDLFRRDQSDSDGSFRLRDVIPGSYTVVAIENGWDLDWAQPGVITHYAKHGQTVTVGNQAGGAVRLREVVAVQPR